MTEAATDSLVRWQRDRGTYRPAALVWHPPLQAALRRKRWESLAPAIATRPLRRRGGRYPLNSLGRRSAKLNCGPWIAVRNLAPGAMDFAALWELGHRPIAVCLRRSRLCMMEQHQEPPKERDVLASIILRKSAGFDRKPRRRSATSWMGRFRPERSTHAEVRTIYASTGGRRQPTRMKPFAHVASCMRATDRFASKPSDFGAISRLNGTPENNHAAIGTLRVRWRSPLT
jgi:hypothetical protein